MKALVYVFLLLLLTVKVVGQQKTVSLNGVVADIVSKRPIEFATVKLFAIKDSSILKVAVSDDKGRYVIEKVPPGKYTLVFSSTGYTKAIKEIFIDTDRAKAVSIEE